VFDAQEMLAAFQAAVDAGREVTFYVASVAASAASFIPTAVKGAKLYMAKSSQLMFHGPWGYMAGGSEAFKDYASLLDKIREDIKAALGSKGVKIEDEWFAEGRMKWYSAKEALDARIADGIRNPPADLVAAEGYEPLSLWELLFGKADAKAKGRAEEIKVAASSVEAMFAQEARMRFGLPEHVEIKAEITRAGVVFTGLGKGIDGALLKITADNDMLPNINWDELSLGGANPPVTPKGEGTMAEPIKPADTGEIVKALADAKAEGYQNGQKEGFAKGKAEGKTEGLEEGKVLGKTEAEAAFTEAKALEKLGVSAEALAYAKDNFEKDCKACRDLILGVKDSAFTEDELKAMSFANLQKTAALVTASGGTKPADRSIFGAPPKGTVQKPVEGEASLPPPSDEFADETK
jgi:hypothetical protein